MEKQTLTDQQCRLVEKYYYLVGQVMNDLKLSENDIEDWHGFFSVVLCEYILITDITRITEERIINAMRGSYFNHLAKQTSVVAEPIGLIKGGGSYK